MSYIGENLRRGGGACSDYWEKLLVKILSYPIPSKEPPDPIRYRTKKSHKRKKILLLGLMDASAKAFSVTNIDLSV